VDNAADRVVLVLIRRVQLNRHEPLPLAILRLPKKRRACGGRIQALPLRDSFPMARRAAFETDGFNSPRVMVSSLHCQEVVHVAQAG
jgi:hypothetical protein